MSDDGGLYLISVDAPVEEDSPDCPFCGSSNLLNGLWTLDDGEVDAVECGDCFAGAPLETWKKRHDCCD